MDQIHFSDVNNHWRNEVLARSGSALLWIQGNVYLANYDVFRWFLEKNWGRIERINIIEHHSIPFFSIPRTASWEMMNSPASNLKVSEIKYTYHHYLTRPVTQPPCPLFKGGAPALRRLSAVAIKFDPRSSWLSNISEITLSSIFSVHENFQVLKATPLLTMLRIFQESLRTLFEQVPSPKDFPLIYPPLLDSMVLRAYPSLALPFLEYLSFPVSCTPDIILTDISEGWNWDTFVPGISAREHEAIKSVQDRLTELLQKSLERRSIINTGVIFRKDHFEFIGDHGINYIDIRIGGLLDGPTILEKVSFCNHLPRVQKLTLDLPLPQASMYTAQIPAYSKSVTTLVAGIDTLQFFVSAKTVMPGCIPFPSLEILKLWKIDPSLVEGKDPSQVIRDFLQWQIDGNSPVRDLDLTYIHIGQLQDMECLDEVPGLKKVMWKPSATWNNVLQYECGSGRPQVLRFKRNRQMSADRCQIKIM